MDEARKPDLDAALDAGSRRELPPNQPQGILGETGGLDIRKVDEFAPDGNAGISQDTDFPVVLMAVLLAYVVFFPVAYVILWRSRHFSTRAKWILSAIGIVGIAAVVWSLRS
jgi:hypothetical protein